MPLVWYYLWIAPHVLQLVMLAIMLRRRLQAEFPLFFFYTAFEVAQFSILFALGRADAIKPETYFYIYSIGLCVSTALHFGVIYEVFSHLCKEYATLSKLGAPFFRWVMAGLLLMSVMLALYAGGNAADHRWLLLHLLERTALILQVGLLLTLFSFTQYLNLSWRSTDFGIALGFGVFASVDLIAATVRSQTGFAFTAALDYLTMGTWHACVLVWLFYLLVPERKSMRDMKSLPEQHDLESWNQELERLLNQ